MKRTFVAVGVAMALVTLGSVSGAGTSDSAADLDNGAAMFETCVACHGPAAAGNARLEVPGIAALPQWYVQGSLEKYRSGARGSHPDDLAALRMRPMSRTLRTQEDIRDVSAYVAALEPARTESIIEGGDAVRGETLYALCATCHGVDGGGNQTLNAPPVRLLNDWYLVNSIAKYKAGWRGGNPLDATGALMRPMAMTLPDEQAVKDVVAYIRTLAN